MYFLTSSAQFAGGTVSGLPSGLLASWAARAAKSSGRGSVPALWACPLRSVMTRRGSFTQIRMYPVLTRQE